MKTKYIIIAVVIIAGGALVWVLVKKGGNMLDAIKQEQANRPITYEEELAAKIAYIKSDAAWYAAVKDRADQYGQTIGERLVIEADWALKNS